MSCKGWGEARHRLSRHAQVGGGSSRGVLARGERGEVDDRAQVLRQPQVEELDQVKRGVSGLMMNLRHQRHQKLDTMFTKDVITCSDNNINNMTVIDMITSILIIGVNERLNFNFNTWWSYQLKKQSYKEDWLTSILIEWMNGRLHFHFHHIMITADHNNYTKFNLKTESPASLWQ